MFLFCICILFVLSYDNWFYCFGLFCTYVQYGHLVVDNEYFMEICSCKSFIIILIKETFLQNIMEQNQCG